MRCVCGHCMNSDINYGPNWRTQLHTSVTTWLFYQKELCGTFFCRCLVGESQRWTNVLNWTSDGEICRIRTVVARKLRSSRFSWRCKGGIRPSGIWRCQWVNGSRSFEGCISSAICHLRAVGGKEGGRGTGLRTSSYGMAGRVGITPSTFSIQ